MGLGGLFMGVWGWWAFDIFTLIASYLSVEEVSAQTIMRTLGLLTFMVPVGISQSCMTLIGKNIGQANIPAIRQYYKLCMYLSIGVAFL
jgi:MATE family multidrug resistance protein